MRKDFLLNLDRQRWRGIFLDDSWYKCWAYYAIQLPTANDLPYGDKSVRTYCLTHGLPYIIVLGNMLVPYYISFTAQFTEAYICIYSTFNTTKTQLIC